MNRNLLFSSLLLLATAATAQSADDARPNILWIFAEDTSPWMSCYGHEANRGQTPNIDSIAEQGVLFSRAYVPAPVCSACRSAMMGGRNQIRFGAHEHRSSRAKDAQLYLPKGMKLLPQLMKESGYYTFNYGKTDYNFVWEQAQVYSDSSNKQKPGMWENLKVNQPFFGQIQTRGGKINTKGLAAERRTKPGSVTVPADYPQNDLYRNVVAQHCDAIRCDDDVIGKILEGLEESGMADNTIVVYFSDHGANHLVRHKQMPTEGGLHVPFVVKGPEEFIPQADVRDDLVNMLDLSATTLAWAGIEIPEYFEGRDLFSKAFKPREFVASAKDRLDHTIDRVRTIRTDRFRYTRNYKLDRILLQPQYRDGQPYLKNLKELYHAGKLPQKLKEIYFGEREAEEFYDVSVDPHQMNNLVGDPKYADELERHRKLLDGWLGEGDMGEGEESAAALRQNGDDWQGGRGVNPEYEINRKDSDGDGLSDKWEKINGRDPGDGRLVFDFGCGGWQTEGWQAGNGIEGNIAGYWGYLGFQLGEKSGTLVRNGLKAPVSEEDSELVVSLKASGEVGVVVLANGQALGDPVKIGAGQTHVEASFSLPGNAAWKGEVKDLEVEFSGAEGTELEVDFIEVRRKAPGKPGPGRKDK